MAFDFKKAFKEYYLPKTTPHIITVPSINYLAVRGSGNPNQENGDYKRSIELLYGVAYTLKTSNKSARKIQGFFEYVVPPLEGFWWQHNSQNELDYERKEDMNFISVIRLPDFITKEDFNWAIDQATAKKKRDFSQVEFFTYDEGLCVQCMHLGAYDSEPATVNAMHQYAAESGYQIDMNQQRLHHEIYLSDPRKSAPDKLKTVIRHPIKKQRKN